MSEQRSLSSPEGVVLSAKMLVDRKTLLTFR